MNVYDFDGTIYDGESVLDFYFFSVKKDIRLARYAWIVLWTYFRYKALKITEEELLQIARRYASEYVRRIPDMTKWVKEFWDQNERKIKDWYKTNQQEDDVVISASFDILLQEICERLGINRYLCSKINHSSGEVESICFHKTKLDMWLKYFPNETIHNFYTDSEMDSPMMEIAQSSYKVTGERVEFINNY